MFTQWWKGIVPRSITGINLMYILLCLISAQTYAQQFAEVVGEIQSTSYRQDGTNNVLKEQSFRKISFVCVVSTNWWRVDHNFLQTAEEKWFFDGTNIYRGVHQTNASSSEALSIANRGGYSVAPFEVARSNQTVTIVPSKDGHPLGNMGINVPWLAFCSGSYLRREGRIIPPPIATLRHEPAGFGFSDKTVTFEDELGLPRKIVLYTAKNLYLTSVSNFNAKYLPHLKNDFVVSTSPFEDGILKFQYIVTRSTNALGWTFPMEFEYLQSEPGRDGKWFARYRGKGKVFSIRSSEPPRNILDPSLKKQLIDYRVQVAPNTPLLYSTTNLSVLPTK